MKKNYVIKLLFSFLFLVSIAGYGQSGSDPIKKGNKDHIEGLNIFPNPVSSGKVYITTKNNLTKNIEIFDVLGKKIVSEVLYGKELKIENLTPGVYILKIKEGKFSATRKLVVR